MPSSPRQPGFPRPFGKFQLLKRLGFGGMAEAFLAKSPGEAGFERTIVVKRMLPHLLDNHTYVDMFVSEARLAAEIRHRNVVQVFELGRTDDTREYYMAMEYIEGTDLGRLLASTTQAGLRIPPWLAVHLAVEVLDALDYAHNLTDSHGKTRTVVHRDVSPSNIFLSRQGEVKLGDFGVAKDPNRTERTITGTLKGKLSYMAPEQLMGEPIDATVDVFAVGVVLWECLAQRRLFGGRPDIQVMNAICQPDRTPPSQVVQDIPPELDAIVLKALQPKDKRTASAKAFKKHLLDALRFMKPGLGHYDVRDALARLLDSQRGPMGRAERLDVVQVGPQTLHHQSIIDHVADGQPPSATSYHPADTMDLEKDAEWAGFAFFEAPGQEEAGSEPAPLGFETLSRPPSYPQTPIPLPADALITIPEPPADVDMDALVSEAVASVRDEMRLPEVQQSSLMAGLDLKKVVTTSPKEGSDRWKYILQEQDYDGPYPIWIRDHEDHILGPCSLEQSMEVMKAEVRAGEGERAMASPDEQTWLSAHDFFELLEMNGLVRNFDLPTKLPRPLAPEQRSVLRVLADTARSRATGRLVFVRDYKLRSDVRELEVQHGRPLAVHTQHPKLQGLDLMVDRRWLRPEVVAEIGHVALSERRPLRQVASERLGSDVARAQSMVFKARLADLFTHGWETHFLDWQYTPGDRPPLARSLLQLGLELTFRYVPKESVVKAVMPLSHASFDPSPDFDKMISQVKLNAQQLWAIDQLLKKRDLVRLTRTYSESQRTLVTMAFFLFESRLLWVNG